MSNNNGMDMSESVIAVLAQQFNGDRAKVASYLKQTEQAETTRLQEKKIQELEASFPTIPKAEVVRALNENNWDVEACYLPLFNVTEEVKKKENEARRKHQEQLAKQKKLEAAQKQATELMQAFKQIPKEKIQKVLDEHNGDIEETTAALLHMVDSLEKQRQLENLKNEQQRLLVEQEKRLSEIKMGVLRERFPEVSEAKLLEVLQTNGGDIKKALSVLLSMIEANKRVELKQVFPMFTAIEIEHALEKAKSDKGEAMKILNQQKAKREAQKEVPKEPVKEVKVSPPPVELKESKVLQPEPLPLKIQDDIYQKSIILFDAVNHEAENIAKADKDQGKKLFIEQLENLVAEQALENMDRMHIADPAQKPALLVNQIDALHGKKAPLADEPVKQVQKLPPPVNDTSSQFSDKKEDFGVMVTLKASPALADIGSNFTVEFEVVSGKSSSSDWIGLFNISSPNKEYLTYQWRGKDEAKGKLSFAAPAEYGEYEFRYFCNRSYAHVAASNRVKVGPEIKIDTKFSEDGKKIHLKWTQLSGNTYSRAWVGLFQKQQTNSKSYLAFDYATKVDMTFDAPVKPGEYEFRYFASSYVDVARSETIRIEGEDKMSAVYKNGTIEVTLDIVSTDASDRAWVGLYFVSETSHKKFRRYQAVKDRKGVLVFNSPKTAGTYEARLFTNGTYDFITKSNPFDVPNGH